MIYETVGTFCPFVGRHSAVGVTAKVGEKEETADHRKKRMAGWIEPLSTLCHLASPRVGLCEREALDRHFEFTSKISDQKVIETSVFNTMG